MRRLFLVALVTMAGCASDTDGESMDERMAALDVDDIDIHNNPALAGFPLYQYRVDLAAGTISGSTLESEAPCAAARSSREQTWVARRYVDAGTAIPAAELLALHDAAARSHVRTLSEEDCAALQRTSDVPTVSIVIGDETYMQSDYGYLSEPGPYGCAPFDDAGFLDAVRAAFAAAGPTTDHGTARPGQISTFAPSDACAD